MADVEIYRSPSPEWPPELDDGSDLLTAIRENDLDQLNRYIASFPPDTIVGRRGTYCVDPFFVAAFEAKPECLRILLEVYASAVVGVVGVVVGPSKDQENDLLCLGDQKELNLY
jgi:hypothetical protein